MKTLSLLASLARLMGGADSRQALHSRELRPLLCEWWGLEVTSAGSGKGPYPLKTPHTWTCLSPGYRFKAGV